MAVENHKSSTVTRLDSNPRKPAHNRLLGARARQAIATVAVAAADDDGTTLRMTRLPSSAMVSSIMLASDALGTSAAYDVGIYETAENGGAAVDDDVFASAVALSSAVTPTEVRFEAGNIADVEKPLWELLGLTEDPNKEYDLVLTGDTAGDAAGDVTVVVTFNDGT